MGGIIFQCQPYPYSIYCTIFVPSPGQEGRWTDAWAEVGSCSSLVLTPTPTEVIEKSPPVLPVDTPPPAVTVQTDPAVPPYPFKRFVSMRIYPNRRVLESRVSSSIPLSGTIDIMEKPRKGRADDCNKSRIRSICQYYYFV